MSDQDRNTDVAEWPERIVYVCKATQAAIVNLAPMFHAGLERIVGLVVLCGAGGPDDPDSTTWREAVEPARRLQAWARETLRLPARSILIHYGNPDSVLGWGVGMRKAAALAAELDAEVVFNLSGGRTAMTFGAQAFWPKDAPALRRFHLAGGPLRAWLVEETEGRFEETRLAAHDRIDLRDYLTFYGVHEFTVADREATEGMFLRQSKAAAAVHARAATRAGRQAFAAWNRVFRPAGQRHARFPLELAGGKGADELAALQTILGDSAIEGLERGSDTLTVTTKAAAKFLTGGWLEAHLYSLILNEFGNDLDVTIASNLSLRFEGGDKDFNEIDIAFLRRGQLHAIEAKTVTSTGEDDGKFRVSLDKLAAIKRQLLGTQGQAWLVAPLLTATDMDKGDYRRIALEAGVRLLFGPDATSTLTEHLRALP